MASSYPSGLDSLQRVAAGDSMQSTSHSGLHNSQSDAIEAIQTVLGLSPQGGSATVGARCAALESDVTGLVSDLAGKAASVHSHAQSDVTGLDTALSGKASTTHASTHAPAGSDPLTVAQSQVTGLPADLAARVTGPASSTDNTLPRFDLATGKVLQGSGVTVDDSNNISGLGTVAGTGLAGSLLSSASPVMDGVASAGTAVVPSRQDHVHPSDTSRAALSGATFTGNVTVSKATANLTVDATSSYASLTLNSAVNSAGIWWFRSGNYRRWEFAKSAAAESGSDAGANFEINRYSDGDVLLGRALGIVRATGKVTVDAVGASAGLEYGSSGPRDMVGTGSPEGVVTAPVGSTWRDTAATAGAIKWIKASGTGNTGWVVEYGDTGQRNLAGETLENGWALASSIFRLRRIGGLVTLTVATTKTSATADTIYTLPSGFRPPSSVYGVSSSATDDYADATVSSGGLLIMSRTYMNVATHYLSMTYMTADAWPSTLPGT